MANLKKSKPVISFAGYFSPSHYHYWIRGKFSFVWLLAILCSCSGGGPDSIYPLTEALSDTKEVVFRNHSTGELMVVQAEDHNCFIVRPSSSYNADYFMCGQAVHFGNNVVHPLNHTHSIEALTSNTDRHNVRFIDADFSIVTPTGSNESITIQLYGSEISHEAIPVKAASISTTAEVDSIYYSLEKGTLRIFLKNGTIWDRRL